MRTGPLSARGGGGWRLGTNLFQKLSLEPLILKPVRVHVRIPRGAPGPLHYHPTSCQLHEVGTHVPPPPFTDEHTEPQELKGLLSAHTVTVGIRTQMGRPQASAFPVGPSRPLKRQERYPLLTGKAGPSCFSRGGGVTGGRSSGLRKSGDHMKHSFQCPCF